MKNIRTIVGNLLLLVFAVAGVAFMAMPWFASRVIAAGEAGDFVSKESVFEAMGDISNTPDTAKSALAFYIMFAIITCILAVTTIISLVGYFTKKKALDFTFINRILSLVLILFGLIALGCSVGYFVDLTNKFTIEISGIKGGTEFFVNGGAVAPLVAAILCAVFAYVVPKNKAKSKSKK